MSSIQVIPISRQGSGAFNGGEIVENKPIGFPRDNSSLRPYSSLFYWAHAKAVSDSTIGLHPHQGFEICSFVLQGQIRHYDTKLQEWRPLQAGDVQIIRAGNGISHSEWMGKGSEMFQIWFDPGLEKTLYQPASYDDYRAGDFPAETLENGRVTTLAGPGSPFRMDTPGVAIRRIELNGGRWSMPANPASVYSAYIIDGEATLNGETARTSDFVLLHEQPALEIETLGGVSVFVIESPAKLGYKTYRELA